LEGWLNSAVWPRRSEVDRARRPWLCFPLGATNPEGEVAVEARTRWLVAAWEEGVKMLPTLSAKSCCGQRVEAAQSPRGAVVEWRSGAKRGASQGVWQGRLLGLGIGGRGLVVARRAVFHAVRVRRKQGRRRRLGKRRGSGYQAGPTGVRGCGSKWVGSGWRARPNRKIKMDFQYSFSLFQWHRKRNSSAKLARDLRKI
jgi:hypothetical protein